MKIFRRKTNEVTLSDLADLKKEFKENLKKQKKDYQKDIDFLLGENARLQRIIKNMAEMVEKGAPVPFNCKLIKDVQYDNYYIPEEKYILYIYIKGEEYSIALEELKNKTFNKNVYTFKIEDEIAHFEIKVGKVKWKEMEIKEEYYGKDKQEMRNIFYLKQKK